MPPQNRSHVPIGAVLEGKYRVTREIGRGGMAAVYEAHNVDIGKRVAVKVLAAELITSRVVRERFIREARAAAAIRSPYICDVYDSGMYEERPFLVMELLEGESLYDMMTRVRRLDIATTLLVTTQTCKGLIKAHEARIIHRDLKPENIFLTHNEEGGLVAKLLDFGLAKFYEPTGGDAAQARLTREGALFGTPAYMSPEQAKGQGEVDHRADLWALGCIVYECLTGRTVWNVDQGVAMILAQIAGAPLPRPSRYRSDLPLGFDGWFFRALDRDATKRFQTAREFADSLTEVLEPGKPRSISLALEPTPPPDLARLQAPSEAEPEPHEPASSRRTPQVLPSPRDDGSAAQSPPLVAIATLLGVAAIALGGYAYWFYALHPPGTATDSSAGPSLSASGSQSSASPRLAPIEREPYALQIGSAQERLARGERRNALKMFREAFNNGGSNVARSLLSQATVAIERRGPCLVTGLGRPRPFDLDGPASAPALVVGSAGPILVWGDNHLEASRVQAFSALLDPSLRRVSMIRNVTPETGLARGMELVSTGKHLVLSYVDRSGDPGAFVRLLENDGRIGGPAVRISGSLKNQQPDPAIARASDGTFFVAWNEAHGRGTADLMLRRLSAELAPLTPPIRLTALRGTLGGEPGAHSPHLTVTDESIRIVFTLERGHRHQVMLLTVARNAPELERGGLVPTKKDEERDRVVGRLEPMNAAGPRTTTPRIACNVEGCVVAWDEDKTGAFAAFIDVAKNQKLWHRAFAVRGAGPTVASKGDVMMIAWYDQSRVKVARIRRDGFGDQSVLARVNGFQPPPALAPSAVAGEWFLGWRDYEAGHLEAFVVRAKCD
ncbi:MAG: serine/threonine protein kinase [Polyangiaceae bacterium]|nr:serine/threonine protein kinase [Polyangiaceae bacterium]